MTRNATLLRAARVRAAKSGRCTSCRYGTPRDGLHTCDRCLERTARNKRLAAKQLTVSAAWCVECQRGDGAHRFGCVARRAA